MTMKLTLNADGTVSTLSLLAEINGARASANEPEVDNKDFINRVTDELDLDESTQETFLRKSEKRNRTYEVKGYNLTEDQAKQVAMRESKAVRKWVVAELNRLYAKAKETPVSVVDLLKQAVATIEAQEQQIRDRALRGVMCTPKQLVAE